MGKISKNELNDSLKLEIENAGAEIVNDFSGGVDKVASAELAKTLNTNQQETNSQLAQTASDLVSHSAEDATDAHNATSISVADVAGHFTGTDVETVLTELFTYASDGKTLIASAITGKNVPTQPTDTFQVMADNIALLGSYVPKTYIYNKGNENIPLTGGWRTSSATTGGGVVTKKAESIYVGKVSGTGGACVITTNTIDLTNINKLKINVTAFTNYSNGAGDLFVTSNANSDGGITGTVCGALGIFELDVSAIAGSYYIGVASFTGASSAKNIEFDSIELL